MRRFIPYVILLVLIAAAGTTTLWSYHQSKEEATVLLYNECTGSESMQPTTMLISCADANSGLVDLKWSAWGDYTAYAAGLFVYNDCTPNCAGGKWREEPITLMAYKPVGFFYSQLSLEPR
jgi:hypothetical protein